MKNTKSKNAQNGTTGSRSGSEVTTKSQDFTSDSQYLVFIGCLPQILTKEDLFQYFSKYGIVHSIEFEEKKSEQEDSCLVNAKLVCSTEIMYTNILENTHRIYGHSIKVSQYMTPEELEQYVEKARNCRIYIKKLPAEITNERLTSLFARYGKIEKAYCVVGSKARKNMKYGYVIFEEEETVKKLPSQGVCYKGQLIVWTSYLNKIEKQRSQEQSQMQAKMSPKQNLTPNYYSNQLNPPHLNTIQSIVNQHMMVTSNSAFIAKEIGMKFEVIPPAHIEDSNFHQLRPTSSKYSQVLNNRLAHTEINIKFNLAPGVNNRSKMLIKNMKRKAQSTQISQTPSTQIKLLRLTQQQQYYQAPEFNQTRNYFSNFPTF